MVKAHLFITAAFLAGANAFSANQVPSNVRYCYFHPTHETCDVFLLYLEYSYANTTVGSLLFL